MGAYKIDQICQDFDIVMKGLNNKITENMKLIAIEILQSLPDNQGRDLALANLLYTAEFIRASILQEANRQIEIVSIRNKTGSA